MSSIDVVHLSSASFNDEPSIIANARMEPTRLQYAEVIGNTLSPEFADRNFWLALGIKGLALGSPVNPKPGVVTLGLYYSQSQRIVLNRDARWFGSSPYRNHLGRSNCTISEVMAHEIGHGVDNAFRAASLQHPMTSPERKIYRDWMKQWNALHDADPERISPYAGTKVSEDIAESYLVYFTDLVALKQLSPERAALCEQGVQALMPNLDKLRERCAAVEQNMSAKRVRQHRTALWLNLIANH